MIAVTWALGLIGRVPWQAWAVVGVMVVVGMIHVARVNAAYKRGYEAAISDVRAANVKAGIAADGGERAVRDCFDAGRVWNRETGKCSTP